MPYLTTGTLPNGINGGYGWGSGWIGLGGPTNFDLNVLGSADSGYVWYLTGYSGVTAGTYGAERFFNGGLETGQTFSFDLESSGQEIYLMDPNGIEVYQIDAGVQANNGRVTFAVQAHTQHQIAGPVDVPYTDEGDHLSITPVDANDAILSVTSYGPSGGTASIEMPYSTIGGVFFAAQKEEFVHVNNLSITPEPGSAALIAAAGLGLLLRRSRRSLLLVR